MLDSRDVEKKLFPGFPGILVPGENSTYELFWHDKAFFSPLEIDKKADDTVIHLISLIKGTRWVKKWGTKEGYKKGYKRSTRWGNGARWVQNHLNHIF